jgi:hypothetical protein
LERFGRPPYGATTEVVQALVAAAVRAGIIEAISSGAHLRRADDARLERVFSTIPTFRAASFAPQEEEIGIEIRTQLAEKLQKLTGERPPLPVEDLSRALRTTFAPDGEACRRVAAAFGALGLQSPPVVGRMIEVVTRLVAEEDRECVRTAAQSWADLTAGREAAADLNDLLGVEASTLRDAIEQSRLGATGLGEQARADHQRLRDLLAAGDIIGHLGEIKALTASLRKERLDAEAAARVALQKSVRAEIATLRERFAAVGDAVLTEALKPLENLMPADGAQVSSELMDAKRGLVAGLAAEARRTLEDVLGAGHLVRLSVSTLAPEPISTSEDLDHVLGTIRDHVESELGAGKRVKLE